MIILSYGTNCQNGFDFCEFGLVFISHSIFMHVCVNYCDAPLMMMMID